MGFEESLTASPLSAEAQGLYTRLLYYANQGRYKTDGGEWVFPEWVAVPQAQLMGDLAIKDRHTLYRVRDELIRAGLIETDKTQGRGSARYRITILEQTEAADAAFQARKTEKPGKNPTDSRASSQPVAGYKSSFDLDEFFAAAVRASLGDE